MFVDPELDAPELDEPEDDDPEDDEPEDDDVDEEDDVVSSEPHAYIPAATATEARKMRFIIAAS